MKVKKLKIAFAISIILLMASVLLGTTATVAWFGDTEIRRNSFNIGEVNIELSYLATLEDGTTAYLPVTEDTSLFDGVVAFEPGYTHVVYLKAKNIGNVDFDYSISVNVNNYKLGINVFGNEIYLPNYLKSAIMFSDDEFQLDREAALALPGINLNTWLGGSRLSAEGGNDEEYIALVITMPEIIDNTVNPDSDVPWVDLGISVTASQII